MINEIHRMWVNQPSNLQQHHHLHGERVLAAYERDDIYRIYFLNGNVISQMIHGWALVEGWPVVQWKPVRKLAEKLVEELSKTAANAVVNQSHYWDKEAYATDRLMVSKSDLATDIRWEVAKALRALAIEADCQGEL